MKIGDIVDENELIKIYEQQKELQRMRLNYENEPYTNFRDDLIQAISNLEVKLTIDQDKLEELLDQSIMGKALSGRWVRWSKNLFGITTYLGALKKTTQALKSKASEIIRKE